MRSHADDAALVQQGWFFLRRVTWAEEEAALEAVLPALPSFLPALVAHVGVPEVAEHAMRTPTVLSYMDDVVGALGGCSWRVHWVDALGLGALTGCTGWPHREGALGGVSSPLSPSPPCP